MILVHAISWPFEYNYDAVSEPLSSLPHLEPVPNPGEIDPQ